MRFLYGEGGGGFCSVVHEGTRRTTAPSSRAGCVYASDSSRCIVLFCKNQSLSLNVTRNRKRRRTSGLLFKTSWCTMRKLNVNTAMPRPLKPAPQAKRVAPPAVPEMHRHSGSSFGSSGYPSAEDGGFTQLRESPAALTIKDDVSEYGMSNLSKSPNSMNPYITQSAFTFPISTREPLTHKAAVYYHQQLALQEDQGIDLTQSPGRDSPGSSSGSAGSGSRHSTASLDSGRASSYITGGGASTRGALSSPRCSVSSCSIGSVDRMSQRSDNDVITDWLVDLKFEEYAQLFISAGYDMPTIARMTPEDLTAIGIKNPQHRELIKKHIDSLQVPDGLPNFVPGSIEEWLRLLRLEEYIQPLLDQNYKTVRDVTQVTWEDLEDIGIVKLGHQKKILLAIKRVKDIISGKWNLKCGNYQQEYQRSQASTRVSWDDSHGVYTDCSGINHENNDIITIKIRQPRGKSLESLEDISERNTRTHLTFSHYSTDSYSYFPPQQPFNRGGVAVNTGGLPPYHVGNVTWRRSYDDGDITPTNEIGLDLNEGGGTLPRQRNNSGRGRIMERTSSGGTPATAAAASAVISPGNLVIPLEYNSPDNQILMANKRYGATCSPLTSKKQAPEPPRRQCSVRNSKTGNSQEAPVNVGGGGVGAYCHTTGKYLHYEQLGPPRNPQQYIPSNHQPIYANYNIQTHQTTAEVHCDKTHDNKSNSSIDSIDTIPFANENTGTIKQRLLNRQEIASSLSLSSSSSSSSTNTVANIAQSFHSLKSSGSLHEQSLHGGGGGSNEHTPPSPSLPSPPIGCNTNVGGSGGGSISGTTSCVTGSSTSSSSSSSIAVNKLNPINLDALYHHNNSAGVGGAGGGVVDIIDDTSGGVISTHVPSGIVGGCQSSNPNDSANVLNDIGNMLANLTDELDAMLEEEKRVGINDSE